MAGLGDLRGVFEPLADNYQQLCQLLHLLHQISTEEEQRPGLLAGDGDNGEMSSSQHTALVSVRAVKGQRFTVPENKGITLLQLPKYCCSMSQGLRQNTDVQGPW